MKKFGATLALLRRHPPPSAASLVSPLCALTHCPQALRSPLSHAACHVASSGLARRVGALPIPAHPPSIPRTACFSSRARGGVAIATGAAVVLPIHSDGTALRVLLKLHPHVRSPATRFQPVSEGRTTAPVMGSFTAGAAPGSPGGAGSAGTEPKPPAYNYQVSSWRDALRSSPSSTTL